MSGEFKLTLDIVKQLVSCQYDFDIRVTLVYYIVWYFPVRQTA